MVAARVLELRILPKLYLPAIEGLPGGIDKFTELAPRKKANFRGIWDSHKIIGILCRDSCREVIKWLLRVSINVSVCCGTQDTSSR